MLTALAQLTDKMDPMYIIASGLYGSGMNAHKKKYKKEDDLHSNSG